jgi:hypothetical protein
LQQPSFLSSFGSQPDLAVTDHSVKLRRHAVEIV